MTRVPTILKLSQKLPWVAARIHAAIVLVLFSLLVTIMPAVAAQPPKPTAEPKPAGQPGTMPAQALQSPQMAKASGEVGPEPGKDSDSAQADPDESLDKPMAATAAGAISGTVVDGGTAPLQTIGVTAYRFTGTYWANIGSNETDAAGFYSIGGLSTGTYHVRFYDSNGDYLREYYDEALDLNSATDVPVVDGTTTTSIDAVLAPASHITGIVTADDGGALLPAIRVNAYHYNGSSWEDRGIDYTDAAGSYDIGGLPGGMYRMRFSDTGDTYMEEYFDDAPDLNSATDISVAAGSSTTTVDAALAAGAHITGTVTADDGGAPLQSIAVTAYRFNGSYWENAGSIETDAAGFYDVGDLPAGTYRVQFYDAGSVYAWEYYDDAPDLDSATDISVATASIITTVDAGLAAAAQISGTVTAEGSGAPLLNITVDLYRFTGSYWENVDTDYTDAAGFYNFGGLPAGTYRVRFLDYNGPYLVEYYDNASDLDSATDIPVAAGSSISAVDAALATTAHITGTVTAADDGALLQSIGVTAYRFNGSYWETAGYDNTDAAGIYDVEGLTAGTYRLGFNDSNGTYIAEFYDNALELESATDVSVAAGGSTTGVDAALVTAAHITGTVTADDGGAPLPDIAVDVFQLTDFGYAYAYYDYTDATGFYDVGGLPAGTYRVRFTDFDGTYMEEHYDDAPDLDSATDISLVAGEIITNIDAALSGAPFNDCVSSTGNNASIAIPDTVAVNGGLTLEANDEFALYTPDGSLCAGHGVWHGTSLNLTAWGDDTQTGEKDGFAVAEEMRIRFWDQSTRTLYDDITVTYSQGSGLYSSDSIHVVSVLDNNTGTTLEISLNSGWNTISSTVDPDNPTLETLLAGAEDDMILMKNGNGLLYWPSLPINDIGDWDIHDGYQIYMTSPATLAITGQQVNPASTPINLLTGWNLVAYLRETSMPVDQAVNSINGQLNLVKNGLGQVYWPAYGVNQIGDMLPGEGYQLYLNSAGTLTYPEN